MNDLLPSIDQVETVNNKLTNDDVSFAFTQSINSKWEVEAKTSGFVNDRIRVFNFIKTKLIEKIEEKKETKNKWSK